MVPKAPVPVLGCLGRGPGLGATFQHGRRRRVGRRRARRRVRGGPSGLAAPRSGAREGCLGRGPSLAPPCGLQGRMGGGGGRGGGAGRGVAGCATPRDRRSLWGQHHRGPRRRLRAALPVPGNRGSQAWRGLARGSFRPHRAGSGPTPGRGRFRTSRVGRAGRQGTERRARRVARGRSPAPVCGVTCLAPALRAGARSGHRRRSRPVGLCCAERGPGTGRRGRGFSRGPARVCRAGGMPRPPRRAGLQRRGVPVPLQARRARGETLRPRAGPRLAGKAPTARGGPGGPAGDGAGDGGEVPPRRAAAAPGGVAAGRRVRAGREAQGGGWAGHRHHTPRVCCVPRLGRRGPGVRGGERAHRSVRRCRGRGPLSSRLRCLGSGLAPPAAAGTTAAGRARRQAQGPGRISSACGRQHAGKEQSRGIPGQVSDPASLRPERLAQAAHHAEATRPHGGGGSVPFPVIGPPLALAGPRRGTAQPAPAPPIRRRRAGGQSRRRRPPRDGGRGAPRRASRAGSPPAGRHGPPARRSCPPGLRKRL